MAASDAWVGGAVVSALDPSVARARRSRCESREINAPEKLERLARLRRQHLSGLLPKSRETQVEQSWNEQIFARLLGYSTQFSNGVVPFDLRPKNFSAGRYDDFSLGFFGSDSDRVIVVGELKDASTDLDQPQHGSYGNLTPVQQAFRVARTHATCRWILVSNLTELRLYSIADERRPVAVALLRDIHTRQDLAMLMAHFDRHALLEGELTMALGFNESHPAMPVPGKEGCYRVVARFTPSSEVEFPLYEAEEKLKTTFVASPCWWRLARIPDFRLGLEICMRFEDGWVGFDLVLPRDHGAMRAAIDRFGQLQVSVRHPTRLESIGEHQGKEVNILEALDALRVLTHMANALYQGRATALGGAFCGRVSAELRDVAGGILNLHTDNGAGILRKGSRNNGVCARNDIETGDFSFDIGEIGPNAVTNGLIAELAIQFRNDYGGVALDVTEVKQFLDDIDGSDEEIATKKRREVRGAEG